ncbi:hypothetical protein BZZ01_10045 [Nostocales cyanobacterium HT-58-2]|nr:hypothetical protein BZZ01_10045 [Nostocales cyanobacterium HT-58-2]
MARIVISDLHPVNSEDSETFMHDLTDRDSMFVYGGMGDGFSQLFKYGGVGDEFSQFLELNMKVLDATVVGFAIYYIASLVKLFLGSPRDQF